jgi:acyl-CoA reductase-like NAD-dependent aldehyde dehydrogenase
MNTPSYMARRAAGYHEIVDALTDLASSATVGDALDENTMVGPMVSAGPPRPRRALHQPR